jgi:FdhE protein
MSDFLSFMARLVQAQDIVLTDFQPDWVPPANSFELALKHGLPPLGVDALRRDIDWPSELTALLDILEPHLTGQQLPRIALLRKYSREQLDALAGQILDGKPGTTDERAAMPFVSAAMQIAWVRMALVLPQAPGRPAKDSCALCPICGSAPAVSYIHVDKDRSGARYLHCGLCSTEWYLPRSRCSVCDGSGKVRYLSLEDDQGKPAIPVSAEVCGDCNSYLKIISREFNLSAEPLADDLGSLPLDFALAEAGEFDRSGSNPLLIIGD